MGEEGGAAGARRGLAGDGDVIELQVLLTGRQVAALEEAARGQGLTSAQLLRRLLTRGLGCEEMEPD
jgi:hypothetical protein